MSKESEMIQNFLKEKDIALASLEDDLNDVVCDEIADNNSKISNIGWSSFSTDIFSSSSSVIIGMFFSTPAQVPKLPGVG